jgi:hypothetical protein
VVDYVDEIYRFYRKTEVELWSWTWRYLQLPCCVGICNLIATLVHRVQAVSLQITCQAKPI